MKILVFGAGAIGSLVGGKLAIAGAEVTLVGRPAWAKVVQAQGVALREGGTVLTVQNMSAVGSLTDAFTPGAPPYDVAIFTVKSYDTEQALTELQQAAALAGAPLPSLLSLQNGVGNENAMAALVGAERVIAGTITTPVSVVSPGVIQVEKPNHVIGLSPWQGASCAPLTDELARQLTSSGFTIKRYTHAAGMKWTKLLMNMMANATSAILDEAPAQLMADPALVDLEIDAWREALAVMQRARIPALNLGKYPFRLLGPLIRYAPKTLLRPLLAAQVGGARGDKMPSLQLDLSQNKGHSEVKWLNGAVAAMGQTLGIPTPVNQLLTDTLLSLVHDEVQRPAWRHNHARLIAASK